MHLTPAEQQFITRRAQFVRWWPIAAIIAFALLAGSALWLLFTAPLLINPALVTTQLQQNAIDQSTLALMAALLPIAVLLCLMTAAALVLFTGAAIRNERRYLQIIRAATNDINAS